MSDEAIGHPEGHECQACDQSRGRARARRIRHAALVDELRPDIEAIIRDVLAELGLGES